MGDVEYIVDVGIEIKLKKDDDFLKVKETLTRIGVASKKSNTLYQTCHILHKQGRLFIVHFKEMFLLDGKEATLDESDYARRNRITSLLQEWNLLTIVDQDAIKNLTSDLSQIKIIPFKDKVNWTLTPKYTIGKKRN